ncbi:prefoldin subunit 1-like [Dendronephthya gigantea]|uniref:prefoldin subunit 1-like n=1 Tax=Dendronephthya gigantea TaxID=151771 RepID=UPI00106D65B9|nr:prefoldin subunit 1-like [Dendronephthya gigantea]
MADPQFDQDLRKAFQDLQALMLESTQKIKISEIQIEQLRSTITRARLTERELDGLPPDTRTYEAVGRMFLHQPIKTIQESLQEKIRITDSKVKTIEGNKQHLESKIKEHEDNIREMLTSRHK